ncbi:hypothetical protein DJ521_04610 [Sulfolobus sp. E3]|nr:hypothetical protein DJ521_04610 [Sulfolobus sp. E3]
MKLCGNCEIVSLDGLTLNWKLKTIETGNQVLDNCFELNFKVLKNTILYKSIIIPYNGDYRISSILVSLGRIKESRLFFKNQKTSIYIEDILIKDISIKDIKEHYSKICGNYLSTQLMYCLGNKHFMIIGKDKRNVP